MLILQPETVICAAVMRSGLMLPYRKIRKRPFEDELLISFSNGLCLNVLFCITAVNHTPVPVYGMKLLRIRQPVPHVLWSTFDYLFYRIRKGEQKQRFQV